MKILAFAPLLLWMLLAPPAIGLTRHLIRDLPSESTRCDVGTGIAVLYLFGSALWLVLGILCLMPQFP